MCAKEKNTFLLIQKMAGAAAAAGGAMSDDAAAAAGPSGGRMFEIKKWNAVALWSWENDVDTCAICRNNIMDPCIECQASNGDSKTECTVAWGTCGVCFTSFCSSFFFHNFTFVFFFSSACVPPTLHQQVAEDSPGLPAWFVP